MIQKITSLPTLTKKIILLIHDAAILIFSLWAALSLRFDIFYPLQGKVWWLFLAIPLLAWPIFIKMGLYRAIIRYLSAKMAFTVLSSTTIFILSWSVLILVLDLGTHTIPRSVPFIFWLLALLFIGGSRMTARWLFSQFNLETSTRKKTLIYGAGQAGRQLSMSLNQSAEFSHIAFIDDSTSLIGMQINGRYVYSYNKIQTIINKYSITDIIIAITSISRREREVIKKKLSLLNVNVQTMPSIERIASGHLQINDIQNIEISNLLNREAIHAKPELLAKNTTNKVVMVTGAGGSIGSEICRQVVANNAKVLIMFELNEFALFTIEQELIKHSTHIIPVLGNVQNKEQLSKLCTKFNVQTIYHAAAYKHVPMVESNAYEGLVNNVTGTLNIAEVAHETQVEVMVLISTDKAVRPTNIMGATKRFAELILQALAQKETQTIFTMVRFGNVLGSSGSVIPTFKKQIQSGGPITVTHPEVTRFFMTIPESVELVIQSGAMAKGGEVFILDMGQPVNILSLAKRMIELSGLSVQDQENQSGDIAVEITGLRPGEKLYEELLIDDSDIPTEHKRIKKATEHSLSWQELVPLLSEIGKHKSSELIKVLLKQAVPEYTPEK